MGPTVLALVLTSDLLLWCAKPYTLPFSSSVYVAEKLVMIAGLGVAV